MALNLNTLLTRSLSAAVFVILLLGSIFWNYYSFSLFFFGVSLLALNEFYSMMKKAGNDPFIPAGFLMAILIYACFFDWSLNDLQDVLNLHLFAFKIVLSTGSFLVLALATLSKKENSMRNAWVTVAGLIYCVLPFGLLNQVGVANNDGDAHYQPGIILGTVFLIWANDTFAYLGGSLIGKHKMIERISPGKTWEGTMVGVLCAFGVSFIIGKYVFPVEGCFWQIMGLVVPVLATVGDLVESKLKRECGVKDSGNIMPGHGGALDRFDSLIFVAPFLYALAMLIKL